MTSELAAYTASRPHNLIEVRDNGIWNVTEQRWIKSGPLAGHCSQRDVERYFRHLTTQGNRDWSHVHGCWREQVEVA